MSAVFVSQFGTFVLEPNDPIIRSTKSRGCCHNACLLKHFTTTARNESCISLAREQIVAELLLYYPPPQNTFENKLRRGLMKYGNNFRTIVP
jgi:hypothetical protein